ncbi:2-hydroxy-6-oxo-6-phenylhexa-2,4-dienoate hydrolase [Actinoplanes sp. OR16]|uniref:alpha/beta fold hydrolase n=1 Tax=Actinoplanes sp. OR16 TaxID=946334 RepID=UPI000F6CEEBC|nr:alpha/beta hydrolase [Actinoplanes sp. OR16]BBH71613.1 2-hydroxy-6-oxo-6-phenylhexa-2,4-dienoate hydrolase [Actinoplanes sp. OR16]
MHFLDVGAGVPVVALHGWTPDHRLMSGCLEPVFTARPGYRRLYPDLPGMGRSAAPPGIASSDDVLAEIHRFIDAEVGEEPFLLLGESYGGYLARAVTRDRPAQVLGVGLICPTVVLPRSRRTVPPHRVLRRDPDLAAGVADAALLAEFEEMAVVRTAPVLRRFAEEIWPGLQLADATAMARIAERWELSEDPDAGPPFSRPSLILAGLQDATVGFADQVGLVSRYPRATVAVLDVAGHNLQIEQPALFEALIGEWLDRVAASWD